MNIDFHYGVIYTIARLAGMPKTDATTVAHACQYVDDATTRGILRFEGGETFERFASAHEMLDYRNAFNDENRVIWAPFHFLPGGVGETLEDKAVCVPDSKIAREMMRRAIAGRNAENALHRLGVSLHVYVDTWAHQGFSGLDSKHNEVLSLEGDDHAEATWREKLDSYAQAAINNIEARALDIISGLGHGAALHFPDMPWAKWHYRNGHGTEIVRDNLPEFVIAADMATKAIQGFMHGNLHFEEEAGLPADSKVGMKSLLARNRNHDGAARLMALSAAVAAGEIPGIREEVPEYVAKGEGSWKHAATGILEKDDGNSKPAWSAKFEDSDYRMFHDAIKEHRFVVTQVILPAHGVRLA